jgi:hypothetical protein
MNLRKTFDGFNLDDQLFLDQHIQPQSGFQPNVSINDRQIELPLKAEAALLQFITETNLVHRFKQPGPQPRCTWKAASITIAASLSRPAGIGSPGPFIERTFTFFLATWCLGGKSFLRSSSSEGQKYLPPRHQGSKKTTYVARSVKTDLHQIPSAPMLLGVFVSWW